MAELVTFNLIVTYAGGLAALVVWNKSWRCVHAVQRIWVAGLVLNWTGRIGIASVGAGVWAMEFPGVTAGAAGCRIRVSQTALDMQDYQCSARLTTSGEQTGGGGGGGGGGGLFSNAEILRLCVLSVPL